MKIKRSLSGLVLFLFVFPLIAQTPKLSKISVRGDIFVNEFGKTFVPIGLNYYRPKTGWAPQVWKEFDENLVRSDFKIMKDMGVTCVRVFLSYGSFYSEPGKLNEEGLNKFEKFLEIAESNGIYIHPTGPDGWEGTPDWITDRYADEENLESLEDFWRLFATRFKNRNAIFAYDLLNEPSVNWNSATMLQSWRIWVKKQYPSIEQVRKLFQLNDSVGYDNIKIPDIDYAGKNYLMAYQHFRETIAEVWIKRQVDAIKSVDPKSLVTVGLIQWSFPVSQVPQGGSAFRLDRINRYLDFIEFHYYPVRYAFDNLADQEHQDKEIANYHAMLRECVAYKKPVVLAEFGMFGGDTIRLKGIPRTYVTQREQADYCKRIIESSMDVATGWLNWGMYDYSEAGDISQYIGLLTEDGEMKEWGKEFTILSRKVQQRKPAKDFYKGAPVFNLDECVLSDSAQVKYRDEFYNYFKNK